MPERPHASSCRSSTGPRSRLLIARAPHLVIARAPYLVIARAPYPRSRAPALPPPCSRPAALPRAAGSTPRSAGAALPELRVILRACALLKGSIDAEIYNPRCTDSWPARAPVPVLGAVWSKGHASQLGRLGKVAGPASTRPAGLEPAGPPSIARPAPRSARRRARPAARESARSPAEPPSKGGTRRHAARRGA